MKANNLIAYGEEDLDTKTNLTSEEEVRDYINLVIGNQCVDSGCGIYVDNGHDTDYITISLSGNGEVSCTYNNAVVNDVETVIQRIIDRF